MSQPKILLLGQIDHAHKTWSSLASRTTVIEPKSTNRDDFIAECKSGAFDGVVAAFRTFGSFSFTEMIDQEIVDVLPKSLKVVCHNGAGYDHFVPSALSSRNILLTNVPTAVDDSTADTALFLLLGALRNFNTSILSLRRSPQHFKGSPAPSLGHDPQKKVLGILGMGGIGRNFARKCRALDMEIVYHNRKRLADVSLEEGARYVGFEELLGMSDVVSVHVPLNSNTRHLLGKKELGMCKKGVVIVNTARGAVIDEAALVEALESGQVGSVGLDVFEEEPKVHEGLLRNDRVLLLPHMGTYTVETQTKMEEWCISNVECAVEWIANRTKERARQMSIVPEQVELFEKMMVEDQ